MYTNPVHAISLVPSLHPSTMSPWRNAFVNLIIDPYINTRYHLLPAVLLHQYYLLPWSVGALLIGSSYVVLFSLYSHFVVLYRGSDGTSWRTTVIFHREVVSNDSRAPFGFLLAARCFPGDWSCIVSLLGGGVISVTRQSLFLYQYISRSCYCYFPILLEGGGEIKAQL